MKERETDIKRALVLLGAMGDDERAVFLLMMERVHAGRKHYGEYVQKTDARSWTTEALHELVDGLWYSCTGLLEMQRGIREP